MRAVTKQDLAVCLSTALTALLPFTLATSLVVAEDTRVLDGQTLHLASPLLAASTPWLVLGAVLTALSSAAIAYAASTRIPRAWARPLLALGIAFTASLAILYAAPHGHALRFFPAMRMAYDAAWCLVWLPLALAASALVAVSLVRRWRLVWMQLALTVTATFLVLGIAPALNQEHAFLRVDVPCFVLLETTLHAGLSRDVPREAITRLGVRQAPPGRWLPGGMIDEPSPGSAHDLEELAAHRRYRERMEDVSGWNFDVIEAPRETGPARITLRATRGLLDVTAEAEITVAREDGDARFPLPAGLRLAYDVTPTAHLELEVMPYEVVDGLRTIPILITRTSPHLSEPRVRTERLVPIDGAYTWSREEPFLGPTNAAGGAVSALFGECILGPPGPVRCTADDVSGNWGVVIATFVSAGLLGPFLAGERRIVTVLVSVNGAALQK